MAQGPLLALAVCCVVPVLCGAFALETNISYTRWWYGLALMLTLVTLTALRISTRARGGRRSSF
ncbi:MAG: hypothetical protein ACLR4A_15025 [Christensenellales bacterium]